MSVTDIQLVEGAAQELPITLYVRGDDYAELQRVAKETLAIVSATAGVKDAAMSLKPGKPEADVRVDRARAADLGVSIASVAQTLRLGLEGEVVAKYRDGDRDIDIRLQLPPERRDSTASLQSLTVPVTGRRVGGAPAMGAPTGPRLVRISDVAETRRGTVPATIERMNRQRQIIITANLAGRSLGDVVAEIESRLPTIQKPEGFNFVFAGMAQRMQETFSNMGIALLTAILFIYFVLASQFESFIHPMTIMLALPLAIVGALLGLFLTNHSIGMPAMIGIILLMGLVTKNAILLVDYTNELRGQGRTMMEALLEAGPTRLRPILMTSAAMVLGMLPTAMARGEGANFRAPMALAVIGGVITSTLLTLLVVPVVYTWMDRFTFAGRRERARLASAGPAVVPASLSEESAVASRRAG
jgi:multidrug efflux pump subunit AcrB